MCTLSFVASFLPHLARSPQTPGREPYLLLPSLGFVYVYGFTSVNKRFSPGAMGSYARNTKGKRVRGSNMLEMLCSVLRSFEGAVGITSMLVQYLLDDVYCA